MKKVMTICLVMAMSMPAMGALISYWPFDEGSGTVASDSVGGNDGTVYGASWTIEGAIGGALEFDGVDDYVDCESSETLKPTQDITIQMWVKPSSTQNTYADILGGHQNDQGYVVQQYGTNTNQYCFAYHNGTNWQGWESGISTQLTADVWQHFVVQKEGDTIRHYLNGILSASGSVSGDIYYSPTEPFYIGIGFTLTSDRYFNGAIDEVAIWDHALNMGEILNVYMHDASMYGGVIELQSEFPEDLSLGAVESDDVIRLYEEQKPFKLGSDLKVDITEDGEYSPDPLTSGTIAAGTWVNCYLLHADRTGSSPLIRLSGSITFDNEILGVIVTSANLENSDVIVGRLGTTYGPRYIDGVDWLSGLELYTHGYQDQLIVVEGSTVTIDVGFADRMDEARVITACSALVVEIDIKPGSEDGDDNTISLEAQGGLIPVAILSDADFDATEVDPGSVALAGADVEMRGKSVDFMAQEINVNGDEYTDLVVHIATLNLDEGVFQSGYAILTGETYEGDAIVGLDYVTVVPVEGE